MQCTIYFKSARPRNDVSLHLWGAAGNVLDVSGTSIDQLNFQFNIEVNISWQDIKFKFRFPHEANEWESDDYIRRIPAPDANEIWTFEYSSRCSLQVPHGPVVYQIEFNVVTKSEFAGGMMLVWNPGAEDEKEFFPETSRDVENNVSHFLVSVRSWMAEGFHFKLTDKHKTMWEPDACIRVWLPSDGSDLWYENMHVNPCQQTSVEKERGVVINDLVYQGENDNITKHSQQNVKEEGESMAEKCTALTGKGNPCKLNAVADGLCRRHQPTPPKTPEPAEQEESKAVTEGDESPVSRRVSKTGKKKAKVKLCGVPTRRGGTCKFRAVAQGRCRKHQKTGYVKKHAQTKEEKSLKDISAAVPQEPPKPVKEKPAAKKCKAITGKGNPCKFKAVVNDLCLKHQPKLAAIEEKPTERKEPAAPKARTGANVPLYGEYINRLVGKEEKEVFEEFYSLLHRDFLLNESSDRMNCEIACLYHVRLLRAMEKNDIEAVDRLDTLLRDKLQDLEAVKVQ